MKASLQQRLEYVTMQVTFARFEIMTIKKIVHAKQRDEEFKCVEERLEKVSRVLNGAEPPISKRNKVDTDAPVADPLDG